MPFRVKIFISQVRETLVEHGFDFLNLSQVFPALTEIIVDVVNKLDYRNVDGFRVSVIISDSIQIVDLYWIIRVPII